MTRRILAWVTLIAFILLITNLIFFRVYWQASIVIYIVILVYFLYTNTRK